jgi:hypothetical protein
MDFIIKLSDKIQDFNGYVEVIQLSTTFDNKEPNLQEMLKIEKRLVEGNYKMLLKDFLSAVSKSVDEGEIISTPLLPKNCLRHLWANRTSDKQEVYIEVPKQRWDITYHTHKFEQVGFPRMIFKYEADNGSVKLLTIVALKDNGSIKEDTEIFHFPFSHVDTSGHVCMGGNSFPQIKSLQQISNFHVLFLSAPFGDDYGSKTTTKKGLRELFKELSNQDFNDEWLLTKKNTFINL